MKDSKKSKNKQEHDLAIKTVRNLRRRYATVVRRIERDNKPKEFWMQKAIPSLFDWMKRRLIEDTYSKRVGTPVRQTRVKSLVIEIKTLSDRRMFYQMLGDQLMKYTDGKEVQIYDDTSYSDDFPEQQSLRIGIPKHHW